MIEVRTSTGAADDARSNEIYNAVWPGNALTNEEAQAFKAAMLDADDHLSYLDGFAAGSAFTAIRPERPDVAFVLVTVLATHRGRGLGSALYAAASRWGAERNAVEIEGFVDEADAASIAFVEARGFRVIKRYERLALDLRDLEEPPVAPVDGVEVTTWDGDELTARGMYEIALAAYRDEPGGEDEAVEPFGDWLEHDVRRLERGGGVTFVARTGGEVVGYAQLSMTPARPGKAVHSYTAVRRDWRGRGVAGCLKRAEIGWAKSRRLQQLETQNEERNEPMLRLNARLGYRPESARLLVRGPLSGGA